MYEYLLTYQFMKLFNITNYVFLGTYQHFAPGALVRPCSSIETTTAVAGIHGSLNTVQAIWLDSKTVINPEQVKEALLILYR